MISIIIVNWNGKKWLKKCLHSLYLQTYKDFEIIFVDNASKDDSVEFVEKHYPKVVIVKSDKNLGFARGNNLGVKKARGQYLLFLNNDVWVENNFLEKLFVFYKENNFDVVGPLEADYYTKKKRQPYNSLIDPFGWHVYTTNNRKYKESFYLTGVAIFVSKSLYIKSGGFDNDFFMYLEEVDWFWRLHLMKKQCGYDYNSFVYHAGSGSSGLGLKYNTFLWRNQNTLQMLLKNYLWYNLAWVLPIYMVQNIFEMMAFFIFLKPKIAWSYIEGGWFNIKYLPRTLEKRKKIQKGRLVGDDYILKRMYKGFGKFYYLIRFISS